MLHFFRLKKPTSLQRRLFGGLLNSLRRTLSNERGQMRYFNYIKIFLFIVFIVNKTVKNMCQHNKSVKTCRTHSQNGVSSGDTVNLVDNTLNSAKFNASNVYYLRKKIDNLLFLNRNHEKITADGEVLTVPDHRVCKCQMALGSNVDLVRYESKNNNAITGHRFGKVLACGSPWLCPICSRKITNFRAKEINNVHNVLSETHTAYMVTFTLSHDKFAKLEDTMRVITKSFNYVNSHRDFAKNPKYENKKFIRALEVTYGETNGWHPHLHVLFFFKNKVNAVELKDLVHRLTNDFYKKNGYNSNYERGITVDESFTAAEYLTKFGKESSWRSGQELAKSLHNVNPNGYHPFELVEAFPNKFLEYADATFRKRQINYSRNIKQFVPNFMKKADEKIAE